MANFSFPNVIRVITLFSRGCSEMPKTRLSQLSTTVFFCGVVTLFPADGLKRRKHDRHHFQPLCFFTELQPNFPWRVWNTENGVITAAKPSHLEGNNLISLRAYRDIRNTKLFHFPIVKKGYNPVSCGWSETPKTGLSLLPTTVFFTELQPCFPNTVKNIEIRVITSAKLEGDNMISPWRNTKLFYFPIVIRGYNPVSPRMLWNTENGVVTTVKPSHFSG